MTVPVIMEPWTVQKYVKVPSCANCREKEPEARTPEYQRPLPVQQVPDVVECETESTKFHRTVSPALIVVVLLPL